MRLIIVESPTKARTLQSFLGPEYRVLSSYGHIRDLPKDEFGIDVEHDFKPRYVIPAKAKKAVVLLKKEAEKAETVILGTDEDREGEAIAWHLVRVLDLDEPRVKGRNPKEAVARIVFHEITKSAIEEALKNPRDIDMRLVDAQQARRILDRIVGYKLSPFLWKKVTRGLSAGRVQSVAVRLVVEREREIQAFIPQEYWTIEALLQKITNYKLQVANKSKFQNTKSKNELTALLVKKDGRVLDKFAIKNKEVAEDTVKDLGGVEYRVTNIEKKEVKRNPLPPFTTSTLQQEAFKKFRFPAKMTMQIAQQLYETGHITYHRTDSLNLSNLALNMAKKIIVGAYGQNYYQFRQYKAKGRAQEAHEAIRPTYPNRTPDKINLEKQQVRLYDLIWRRFIACQMKEAIFDATTVEIAAKNYTFRAAGQILKFDGFLRVYPVKFEESQLPPLKKNEILELIKLIPSQHFTQPPPRYTEATLIKALEENGIGRPSTYAPIISTIQERNYVEKDEQKRFKPTDMGIAVNDLLVTHFPKIVDLKFTAEMEENLDKIAAGEKQWVPVVREFYQPFSELLEQKYQEVSKREVTQTPTEKKCPACGGQLIIRLGRYGKFHACSNFPKCKYTEPLEKTSLEIKCPKCGEGEITERRTKTKKVFYSCSRYPECDFALWDRPTGEKCKKCGQLLVQRGNKIKCSNKDCDQNT